MNTITECQIKIKIVMKKKEKSHNDNFFKTTIIQVKYFKMMI